MEDVEGRGEEGKVRSCRYCCVGYYRFCAMDALALQFSRARPVT